MARPVKTGLDYFPLDVNIDEKIELIEAEHGLSGFAIIVKLWQKIYANGYFMKWDDDHVLLFTSRINSELTIVNSVINSCFRRGIFDENLYKEYQILTSSGIQKRFFIACKQLKRSNIYAEKHILLVNPEDIGVSSELTIINSEFSTQRKGKEKKGKEKKEEDSISTEKTWKNDFEIYQNSVWQAYNTLILDKAWISDQEHLNPGLDILLTIEKAIKNYWLTDKAWKKKIKDKVETINWKLTFAKTMDINKVMKQRTWAPQQSEIPGMKIPKM